MTTFAQLAMALAMVTLVACGGAKPAADDPPPKPKAPTPAAEDFSAWGTWTKLNAARWKSKTHGGKWVDVYVPAEQLAAYKDRSNPAPVGMQVAKVQYTSEDAPNPVAITAMVKKDAGYDPEHGDWYYGMLSPDGKFAKGPQGKVKGCRGCHTRARDKDYLFGLP